MAPRSHPPLPLSTAVVAALTVIWVWVRLVVFGDSVIALSYVVPLMICVWTQKRWHLGLMASIFTVMTFYKAFWILPESYLPRERALFFWTTFFNIVVGSIVIHFIMALRERLEARNALISTQNAELEAQAEELSQQNEEIRAQTEELAQQNEEIESQAEELERQNAELQETNTRMASREEMLEAVIEYSRKSGESRHMLDDVCRRALDMMDQPAEAVALLEMDASGQLQLRASARNELLPVLHTTWPMEHALASVVLREDRTAYVDDLNERGDLAAPFSTDGVVRSLLATPLRVGGKHAGVVVAMSRNVTHWTREQFRLIEWVSAQCGFILEGLRWQEALELRAAEVEAANQAKDRFLAMLSHELRTPLTPVIAAAGALEADERLPDDARDDVRMIGRNVAVQSRLIDDLLDLTRIGRGKLELQRRVLEIATLLHESARIVAPDLDAREQSLTMRIDLPPGCAVDGDGPRLQQVIWNLLKNAIKFSPAKGHIVLTARLTDAVEPCVEVAVSDQGIGIDPADLQRIFQPFEQAASGWRRGNGQGLGLGLCIAKAVVELHGGTIRVSSEGIGRGATFTVELPQAAVPISPVKLVVPVEGKAAAAAMAGDAGVQLRILLVEDHQDTGRMLARLLRAQGHAVEHAQDMASALNLLEGFTFDLIVSDLGLPDGSGLDLMRQIRSKRPELAGICLSGYGMEGDVQSSLDAGFREHLTKPVELQQLHAAIDRIARSRSGA